MKAILFDLDGTLLDSIPGILESFRHVLSTYLPHKAFTRRELVMVIGEPIEKQMLDFADGDAGIAAQMVQSYREYNRGLLPSMPLYPGVLGTLSGIRARGQKTGLVTSKGRASAMVSLEGHGLSPLFDLVLTSDDTQLHKPDPEPLLVACQRLGIRPADVAYVGDSVHDIRCALAAGCFAVAALWGPFEQETLSALGPQLMAEKIDDLLTEPQLLP